MPTFLNSPTRKVMQLLISVISCVLTIIKPEMNVPGIQTLEDMQASRTQKLTNSQAQKLKALWEFGIKYSRYDNYRVALVGEIIIRYLSNLAQEIIVYYSEFT